ncbi:MAG: hypothetical protein LM573_02285 [Thermofilum sp.]|nr:hypothetical protein [Thermofilum sp.]
MSVEEGKIVLSKKGLSRSSSAVLRASTARARLCRSWTRRACLKSVLVDTYALLAR